MCMIDQPKCSMLLEIETKNYVFIHWHSKCRADCKSHELAALIMKIDLFIRLFAISNSVTFR